MSSNDIETLKPDASEAIVCKFAGSPDFRRRRSKIRGASAREHAIPLPPIDATASGNLRAFPVASSRASKRFPRGGDKFPQRSSHRPTMIFDDKARVENDPRRQEREYIAQTPYVPNAI